MEVQSKITVNLVEAMQNKAYSAGIMSQSFWFVEFKKYLTLLKRKMSYEEIKRQIADENLFGLPNEYRARRVYGYISNRARALNSDGIALFFSSDLTTQKLINLICVLRSDRLFFEFLYEIYRDKIILGSQYMERADINTFFIAKSAQSDDVERWNDSTKKRVGSAYLSFMTEAGLLTYEGRKRKITPPLLDIALENYLRAGGETSIIKAITGEN